MSHDQQILAGHCTGAVALPAPRVPMVVRAATMQDLPFIDALQKQHSKALGFFPRAQMEGYVSNQWVLIAEDAATKQPLGYCASRDRYLKRDELGVIYQLCVSPGAQRKLVGAALVREVFERSAYGCRLYCCWCAQDLEANYFWESMGFVPIAFRAGSSGKKRVHIFWQKRIVEGDEQTRWWYPFQTNGGAIRADRIVFPIPPGVHWTEVQAVATPTAGPTKTLPVVSDRRPRARARTAKPTTRVLGGFRFQAQVEDKASLQLATSKAKKPKAAPKPKGAMKLDPRFLSAARELRDRWLEKVNEEPALLTSRGKYEVSRLITSETTMAALPSQKALPAKALAAAA